MLFVFKHKQACICLPDGACRMAVELTDKATKQTLGLIETLDTPSYSRSPAGRGYSYCLNWAGVYQQPDRSKASLTPGRVYGMRVLMEAPLAVADRQAGQTPRTVPVSSSLPFHAHFHLTSCLGFASLARV